KVGVTLIPVNGGRERQLAEFQSVAEICWHPSGKWLAVACKNSPSEPFAVVLHSPETGETRSLTSPPKGIFGDRCPTFSPDGRRLAFSRSFSSTGTEVSEIYVLHVSGELEPEGGPKQLTFGDRTAVSPAWTPDGKELVFVFGSKDLRCGLWRLSVFGSDKPRPLPFSGEGGAAFNPSVSLENHRLLYNVMSWDINIWRYQTPGSKEKPAPPSRFIPSSQTQEIPQYSPDSQEVVYVSYASGSGEIWISSSDGSNPLQLTHFGGPTPDCPRWSRDGKQIVFSMASRDMTQIFSIPAQGGQTKQLTNTPFNKRTPSYSRDGKWVYFSWNRGGDAQIWKMPVEGGEPVQVTSKGGFQPLESMDGRILFYLRGNDVLSSLWMVAVGGGEEIKVLDDVLYTNFDVKEHGIYYTSGTMTKARFLYYDLASRKTRLLAPIQGEIAWGFTVSADEGWILLTLCDPRRSNLMLVENFH
ncbi:MAG TPA: hypothetical protein VMW38_21270, partial [Terriglobia bacterium]|nr:hypothetical protein [Terriglobia bacterium]